MLEFLLDNWMLFAGLTGIAYSTFTLHTINYKVKDLKYNDIVSAFEICTLISKYNRLIKYYRKSTNTNLDEQDFENYRKNAVHDLSYCICMMMTKEDAYKSLARLYKLVDNAC